MADAIDEKVNQLLTRIQELNAQIKAAESSPRYKTNMTFEGQNLNVLDVEELNYILVKLTVMHEASQNILPAGSKMKYGQFLVTDWINDVKDKTTRLNIKEKKASLLKLEAALNAIISPEKRRELELKKAMEELENLG